MSEKSEVSEVVHGERDGCATSAHSRRATVEAQGIRNPADLGDTWKLALAVHQARMKLCYGHANESRQPFPMTELERRSYSHNPNPWVDQALAIARAIRVESGEFEVRYLGAIEAYKITTKACRDLTAERDRLKAALEKYGRHTEQCRSRSVRNWGSCDCGFPEALSPATPTDKGNEG